MKHSLDFQIPNSKYTALIPIPWVKANLEHSRHVLLSKLASASHMSEMITEADMPATSSDIRGQIKESATKSEKHQP